MGRNHQSKPKKKLSPAVLGLLLLLACALTFGGFTAAKYVLNWASGDQMATAKKFYFTSDHLQAGDYPVYRISVPSPEEAKVAFSLRNFDPAGSISETDISYQYTVTVNSAASNQGGSGSLTGRTSQEQPITLALKAADFINGKATVRVVATASPYDQTLGGVFELYLPIQGATLSVRDAAGSNTLTMLVTTGERAGTVTIQWNNSAILPDSANYRFTQTTATSCTFYAEADAQYSFAFFKADPSQVYSDGTFTLGGL